LGGANPFGKFFLGQSRFAANLDNQVGKIVLKLKAIPGLFKGRIFQLFL
jgi:hypothetical protein